MLARELRNAPLATWHSAAACPITVGESVAVLTPERPAPTDVAPDDNNILAAGLQVFSELGYGDATLHEVAHRAGTTLQQITRHYPSKDDLFREVVRWTILTNLAQHDPVDVAADAATGQAAADQVREFARRYWSTMERPELVAMIRLTISELPRFPELAVFHATEALERFLRALERIIGAGVARGELRTTDVRAAARTVLATLAAHTLWFAYPDIYSGITGADREKAAAATINSLIHSLSPGDS